MNLSPLPIQKFWANNGRPLVGGLLFTYEAGTSDKVATYTDASGSSQNTNPIVLDFRGECRLWIDPQQSYKFILSPPGDTDPPTRPIWAVDNITAAPLPFDNAAVDTGGINNVELSIPWITSPVAFTRVVFRAANTNTGPTTLQINGGTALPLRYQNAANLGGGELQAGGIYEAIFDGAQWQLQSPALLPTNIATPEEIAAGVVITDYAYLPGQLERYGAVGNGIVDDTVAWQSAVKVGGYVRGMEDKIYRITGPAYLTVSDTTIDMRGCTINQVTAATPWLIIGRTQSNSTFVKTDRIQIIGGTMTGAVAGGGDPAYGISIHPPPDNPFVNGNGCNDIQVIGHTASGFTGGLVASGASNIKAHDCSLGGMIYHLHLGAGGYGLLFQTCFDIIVTGNRFKATSTDRHAVYVSTYSDPSYPKDNSNICKGVVVSDNLMDWVGTAGVTGFEAAIEVRSAESIAITGNAIYGGYGGIDYDNVNGNGSGIAIVGNVVRGIHAGASQRTAIGVFRSDDLVSFTATDVVIANNSIQFDDDNVNGIAVDNCFNVVVSDNVINFNEGIDGIIFSDSDNIRVGSNVISSANGSSAIGFAGVMSDITVGQGTHKGVFGSEYRYYSNPIGIKFDCPRTVTVSWTGGVATINDPDNIATSAASDPEGFTLTFESWVIDLTLANLAFTSSSSNVCAIYRRGVGGQVLTVGVKDFAGVGMPAASNDYSIAITLKG